MSQQANNSCEMFGITGVIVQLVLGALSFSVLIFKRYHEFPKRPWRIWAMDTSKQGVSQLIAHFINIGISLLLSSHLSSNACIWYFTTNVLDNTLGVFICCGTLRLVETFLFAGRCQQFRSGNYYDIIEYDDEFLSTYSDESRQVQKTGSMGIKPLEISTKKMVIMYILFQCRVNHFAWIIQFLVWNLIVAICKSILFFVELLCNKPLNAFSQFLIGWVQPYPTLELVLVMIIFPVIFNGLAFWIQDNFLKKNENSQFSIANNGQKTIKEPLM